MSNLTSPRHLYTAQWLGSGHICVLEVRHGSEIGGIARCWGNEEEDGKSKPPDDVSLKKFRWNIWHHDIHSLVTFDFDLQSHNMV